MNSKRNDRIATGVIYFLVGLVILLLIGIIGNILLSGVPHLSWDFLTKASSSFEAGGGIRDQLFNSLYLLVLTLLISLPIALGAAIYLAEYAADTWLTRLIRTTIEILSSLPSIVVGLFGYLVFVVQFGLGFSIIAGALALTFFNLPILTSNIEQAINGVPQAQREAGWALGLSNWKTIRGIVLPAALPGIITGVILSAGRVFGEAAALIYTAGQSGSTIDYANWNIFSPTSFLNVMRPAETLAVHIWKVNTEGIVPDVNVVSAATSALLIIVVIIFNFGARALGNWLYKRLTAAKAK
ncbi:phosphate ABC transporter permease PstA [Lactobacillus sp. ESL0684]|uniref:phosphate ABC transporter permease PstA n=1 Tax=Lactobacillus sp. ESL0684 TaxID=2983213 RepID=UPI0023F8AD9D|nr:phosphate ABC transporter permease PstA [Lactobacillus sp. ESL0684]WEV44130.1 phosphate ABC transporter permease PstA [Lactobacillus sp. ESL0684]